MFWIWLGLALVAGLVGGFMGAATLLAKIMKEAADEAARHKASDQNLLMRTFRRELANWLFRADPDRYRTLYERARATEAEIMAADRATRHALLTRIATDMPFIADFDFMGSREFVTYADALSIYSRDEIEEKYLDIVRWQSLQIAGDPAWKYADKPTSESDLAYLPEYTKRLKDSRFKKRLEETMRLYWFSRRGEAGHELDNDLFSVKHVYHLVESRYGIHLKDTNEFGLFSAFYDRDRDFESYYRSSADFTEEKWLEAMVEG
jgi:hypothetical protein